MDSYLDRLFLFAIKLGWGVWGLFSSKELLSYANIGGALLVSLLLFNLRRGKKSLRFWQKLFPKRIWRHPSAKQDVLFYLVIQPIKLLILSPALLILIQFTAYDVVSLLEDSFGASSMSHQNSNKWWAILAYTTLLYIAVDFAFFISHYFQHKWKWLWCFHKVHHSAPVLTPFTAMRFHPLDMAWNMGWAIALSALVSGLCQYSFYNGEETLTLLGNNLFVGLSYLTTHHFRHSHIWLHYPHWLSNWIISPVMHQIHHSVKPEHWDKNFGYLFAGWDRLFGTLVNPKRFERIQTGITNEDGTPYTAHSTWRGLFLAPFKEAWALLHGK